MCGFAGLLDDTGRSAEDLRIRAAAMADAMPHRGPDDRGDWVAPGGRVALGFRRLAIQDLTEAGHQPMQSSSGRFTLVFNGEVYNHFALRRELGSSVTFRGHADTETLLAGFERWGIPETIRRTQGMFALAVWDEERAELTLGRDRIGKKPLYLYQGGGVLAFGSELRALRALPGFSAAVDPQALASYLRYLYVPAPLSILAGVRKLLPGHLLTVQRAEQADTEGTPYWSPIEAASTGNGAPIPGGSESAAVDALEELLGDATEQRLISDVPVGALLSGGIDSSLVVALMAKRAAGTVRTYAVSFPEEGFDESAHAASVAAHLGTTHTTFDLSSRDLLDVVPQLPELFDEPIADPSCVPTYLVCKLARRDVTVALTGDGGDEAFAGYNRYRWGGKLLRAAALVPGPLGRLLPSSSPRATATRSRSVGQQSAAGRRARLFQVLRERNPADRYAALMSAEVRVENLLSSRALAADIAQHVLNTPGRPLEERMMLCDQLRYLPDDLLAKVDRASMAVSLEARCPLLDYRVLEFAWRLPLGLKIRAGSGKWILRELLARHVPRALFERPKMGFSAPVAAWLRGPLRDWAEELLGTPSEHLDAAEVQVAWRSFLDGAEDRVPLVWALVTFRAWEERWRGPATGASPLAE